MGFLKRTNKRFDYKPRFYDSEKEGLEERLKKYESMGNPDPDNLEDAKTRIQSGLRSKQAYGADQSYRRQAVVRSNLILVCIICMLAFFSFVFLSSNKIDGLLSVFLK